MTAFHPFIVIVMPNCQRHKVVVQKKDKPKTPQVADSMTQESKRPVFIETQNGLCFI